MCATSGIWVAHGSGSADRDAVDKYNRTARTRTCSYAVRRVWLSQDEEEGYYYGFSNSGLWPLCHNTAVRPRFREGDWYAYRTVNRRFAEAVAEECSSERPIVLVQDYHLALLPAFLRARVPHATIIMFWHIPWPSIERLKLCPWAREILQQIVASDIVGFHTGEQCTYFSACVREVLGAQVAPTPGSVLLKEHACRVAAYPASISWPPTWLLGAPSVALCRHRIRRRYEIGGHVSIGLAVDRWDFTKGIIERLLSFEMLLNRSPQRHGMVTLLQVAAPTRGKLSAYRTLQARTRREIDRINRKFERDTWKPIVFVDEHQNEDRVCELYRGADFCIVNSLHDGMNLVAKEFVAAREDEDGVLILSRSAGASRELVEAIVVDPLDIAATASAIAQVLDMPRKERRTRMRRMRATVERNNAYRWAGQILLDSARISRPGDEPLLDRTTPSDARVRVPRCGVS